MGSNYQASILALKSTALYRFLKGSTYVRKMGLTFITIFFPWSIIRKLKLQLKRLKEEVSKSSYSESVNLFTQNKIFGLLQQDQYFTSLARDKIAGMLHWPELIDKLENENGFGELLRLLSLFYAHESLVTNPSNCWVLLAAKNCDQLLKYGYDNFKRTIGHNYFNFLVQKGDPQIKAAEQLLPSAVVQACWQAALAMPHDPLFQIKDQVSYYYFILLLWEYVRKIDIHHYLDQLEEPREGNPILVHAAGKSMSQDLANSLIEYYSINQSAPFGEMETVLEIGDGYGRNAHVILALNPRIRIILVDIMPALYIAQHYLSSVFKERKVFKVREFTNFEDVREEMEAASIVFLMPHQLKLLPDKLVDLSMNISSFGEMNVEQINWYFSQIDRLTRAYFYTKQWNESKNPFDGLLLKKADYPYRPNWEQIYSRNCEIQSEFFETLFRVNEQCSPQTA